MRLRDVVSAIENELRLDHHALEELEDDGEYGSVDWCCYKNTIQVREEILEMLRKIE